MHSKVTFILCETFPLKKETRIVLAMSSGVNFTKSYFFYCITEVYNHPPSRHPSSIFCITTLNI
jgi:hypothetical protein